MILRILEGLCKRLAASIYRLGSPEWFDERESGGLPPAILHIPGDRYVAQFLHHAGPLRTAREPTLPWEHDVWRRPRSAFPWFESYQAASASLYDQVWMTGWRLTSSMPAIMRS